MAADVTVISAPQAPPHPLAVFWHDLARNRGALLGLAVVVLIALLAIFADVVAPHAPAEQFRAHVLQPPAWVEGGSWAFPLGTDEVGRDILSRLIYGARYSLFIGISVVAVALVLGISLGFAAAFVGGLVDVMIERLMDLIMSVPSLVLAIVIVAIIGPSLTNTIIAVTIVYLPRYVRIVRAAALSEKAKDYVTAAKTVGVGRWRLMFVTVLPNCVAPIIVQATLGVSDAILEAAALGFLGLGAQPPTPEWGTMLAAAREFLQRAPWVVTWPGLAILVTVVSINLFGDGLRDALDPRLKRS
ncbi:ABC transporter permease subunit [Chelatococcus sp. SYSU_G07232]|uniref:ABC transporter permease subunit n=1 Tax=Chelatococcus albus TaxID=3047466 RepID=A0ABT7AIE4_9HYPH|nr:ABC transporter permease subunit [Chelatococcus sp. SYSU_G07232]MDJ1159150.1 ABC transporter permease subunit [Chelatococcus sp. SYSU_G07232]